MEQSQSMQSEANSLIRLVSRSFNKNHSFILIVQYDNDLDKLSFIEEITNRLTEDKLTTKNYDLYNDRQYDDGGLYNQLALDSKKNRLSIISSLPLEQSGSQINPKLLNYLNLYRDRITQHNLHIVLFIHNSHMKQFMTDASDLWSFKRKTFWLERAQNNDVFSSLTAFSTAIQVNNDSDSHTETAEKNNQQQIAEYLQTIKQQLDETETLDFKVQILISAAIKLVNLNEWIKALELTAQAKQILSQQSNWTPQSEYYRLFADTLFAAGIANHQLTQNNQALSEYLKSLEYYKLSGQKINQYYIMLNIANIYINTEQYTQALEYCQQALHGFETHNVMDERINALETKAKILQFTNEIDNAIDTLKQALKLSKKLDSNRNTAQINQQIAECYETQANYQQALNYIIQSIDIYQRFNQATELAQLRLKQSLILVQLDQHHEALEVLAIVKQQAQAANLHQMFAMTLAQEININIELGLIDAAITVLNQLKKIEPVLLSDDFNLLIFTYSIQLNLLQGNKEKAINDLMQFYPLAKASEFPNFIENCQIFADKLQIDNGIDGLELMLLQQEKQSTTD